MKKLLMSLAITLSISSVFALETFLCKEDLSSRDAHKTHYTLKIEETKEIGRGVMRDGEYVADYVYDVKVTIGRFNPNTGRSQVVKQFNAISSSEDVYYGINAIKENSFAFNTYLDETSSSSMRLANSRGVEKEVHMSCDTSSN